MLHGTSLATALIDRLLHHEDVDCRKEESYRLTGKQELLATGQESATERGRIERKID